MRFDELIAKNTKGWIPQVKTALIRNLASSSGEIKGFSVVEIIPHIVTDLTLSDRLLLIQTGLEIKQVVKIKDKYVSINESDHILVFGGSMCLLEKEGTPFFVMTHSDYQWKYYNAKHEDLYKEHYLGQRS